MLCSLIQIVEGGKATHARPQENITVFSCRPLPVMRVVQEETVVAKVYDIAGLRCTNHLPNKKTIVSGVFDIYNPCSWCSNRKNKGTPGPAFHYVEYGHWEFPFVAESTCQHFSLIHTSHTVTIDPRVWERAKAIHDQRNRIADLGRRFSTHWAAYDFADDITIQGENIDDRIIYPNSLSAEAFFSEASRLRIDFFSLKMELRNSRETLEKEWKVKTTQMEVWIQHISKQMGILTQQIDELESSRDSLSLKTVSKWAFGGVTGSAAWEGLKWTKNVIVEILK